MGRVLPARLAVAGVPPDTEQEPANRHDDLADGRSERVSDPRENAWE